jgi:hypothetical protein
LGIGTEPEGYGQNLKYGQNPMDHMKEFSYRLLVFLSDPLLAPVSRTSS